MVDGPDLTRVTRLSEISTQLPSHCTDTDMSDYYYYSPTSPTATLTTTLTTLTASTHTASTPTTASTTYTSVSKTGPTIRNIYAYDEYLHGFYARQLKTALEV